MSSSEEKDIGTTDTSLSNSSSKSKPVLSALEKYGFMPSKPQSKDYDDDYDRNDDDDYQVDDDYKDAEENEEWFTEEDETEERTEAENTDQEMIEEEEGEEQISIADEDVEDYSDASTDFSGIAGDWRVVTVHGSEDGSEEMDEVDDEEEKERQERKERRISSIQHKKDFLIVRYLTFMKHLGRLRRQNLYLQDYLYKLCFRMKLIKDPSEVQKTDMENQKSAVKLKRQKKKQSAKMAANYEAFVNAKQPTPMSPEIKENRKPTRAQLTRTRRLVKGDKRPPNYSTKLDTKIISIRGVQYQRMLRSASRNWPEEVEQDDTKNTINELKKKEGQGKDEVREEIRHGLPGAAKQRVLVQVIPSSVNSKINTTPSLAKQTDEIPASGFDTDTDQYDRRNKRHCKKNCIKRKKRKEKHHSQAAYQRHVRRVIRKSGRELKKSRRITAGIDMLVSGSKNQRKSRPMKLNVSRRMFEIPDHHHCRRKNKFREYNWFDNGKLKGRHPSGTKLFSAEKQHLINYVNSAILNTNSREKSKKLKKKQNLSSTDDWNAACSRLFLLLVKKDELEKQHKKTMQQKFISWGIWERRNLLTVEVLLNIFKIFVLQPYYTKGELKRYISDIDEFASLLHTSHERLMEQLLKMYKSRLALLLVQRRLKDKTDQTLNRQGLSITYFEQLSAENKSLYERVQEREQNLEKQRAKLASTMKTMVLTQDFKGSINTKVKKAHGRYQIILDECQNKRDKALGAMDTFNEIIKKHEPLLLQAHLVEKPHLLHDFTTRKKCLENLDSQKRKLSRLVYLSERELNTIHIKMKNTRLDIREMTATTTTRNKMKEMRVHKAAINGRMDSFIANSTNHCGGDNQNQQQSLSSLPSRYQNQSYSTNSSSVPSVGSKTGANRSQYFKHESHSPTRKSVHWR